MKISSLIANVLNTLKKWHTLDLKFWDNHHYDCTDINNVIENLAYRNYCGWHLHELYFENLKRDIVDGSQITQHNLFRNQCMEVVDSFFSENQNTEAKYHSEGFGNIIDRIINDYIKYLHCLEIQDERSESLKQQVEILIQVADELQEEVLLGQKQVIVWKRFKVQYE